MKEVFRQYGGVLIAAAATSAFLVLMGNIVLAQGGMLAQLINILSSDSANDSYDSMKNIPVPGIELKEKMRQNAVSYSVYDLLDVTAHEDNLDKLEVYALYDSGRNDCTGSISADGSSLSFPDYGVYDMHVRITCKNGTRDHVRISIPINRKVADI